MKRIKKIVLSLVVLLTMIGLVGGMFIPTPASVASIQPQLTQLSVEMPDKVISVIAQKTDTTQRAEKLVLELGGEVTKDLHIINAFAADISPCIPFALPRLKSALAVFNLSPDSRANAKPLSKDSQDSS